MREASISDLLTSLVDEGAFDVAWDLCEQEGICLPLETPQDVNYITWMHGRWTMAPHVRRHASRKSRSSASPWPTGADGYSIRRGSAFEGTYHSSWGYFPNSWTSLRSR